MDVETGNLALRGLLEAVALVAFAVWGWLTFDGVAGVVLALVFPVAAAALWGTFRVPDDPGPAPVVVPGPVRLALELSLFGLATAALFALSALVGLLFGAHVVIHYVVDAGRVRWLLSV